MLPSESDRSAWFPLAGVMLLLIGIAIFAGAGTWMLENITPPLNTFLESIATIFGLNAVVHGFLILPLLLMHKLLTRVTGLDIG